MPQPAVWAALLSAAVPFAAIPFAAAPLFAQEVRGLITDGATGDPIAGAFVSLLDDDGDRVAGALSGVGGGFRVAAAAGGRFSLRVEHLGYAAHVSEAFDLGSRAVVSHDVALAIRPIALPEVIAEGERRCEAPGDDAGGAWALWEAARTALRVASWAAREQDVTYRIVRYSREVDPETGAELIAHWEERIREMKGSPWALAATDVLLRDGFAQPRRDGSYDLFVPSPDVFTSDAFLESHCFNVRTEGPPREGWIGLAFEPVDAPEVPDIEGVLWLDRRDLALRSMEYRYVYRRRRNGVHGSGGTVEFAYLPSGLWIMHRWAIRTPVSRQRFIWIRDRSVVEDGARVARVFDPAGKVIWADPTVEAEAVGSAVAGPVDDPSRRADHASIYAQYFSFAAAAALRCGPRTEPATDEVHVVGFIADPNGGPLSDATVTVRWTEEADEVSEEVEADEVGLFVVCEVPAGIEVVLDARRPGFVPDSVIGRTVPGRLFARELRLHRATGS